MSLLLKNPQIAFFPKTLYSVLGKQFRKKLLTKFRTLGLIILLLQNESTQRHRSH